MKKNNMKDLIRIERKNDNIIIYHYLYIDIKIDIKNKIIEIKEYKHNCYIKEIIKDFKKKYGYVNNNEFIILNRKIYKEYNIY